MWKYQITENKSKSWKILKKALILVLLGFTIYLCFRNYKLSREVNTLKYSVIEIPDTVYLDETFKPQNRYSDVLNPWRVLVYKKQNTSTAITDSSLPLNSIGNFLPDSTKRSANSTFSNQDSLIQALFDKNKLELSFYNQQTDTYYSKLFDLNLDKFKYNWYEGQLTQQKLKRFLISPYLYGKYRPFNQLLDIGTGIEFKTKRFNYKLGVNAFYYPKFKKGIGSDLELSVQYNF